MIRLILLLFTIAFPVNSFAMGGNGATCTPATANWGSCNLQVVPFSESVTNTVNISSGNYTTPYQANQSNTKYILQGNISANSTAIEVRANYVIIDLNGYTITYNNTSAGEGVVVGDWNLHHIAVTNGSIVQGAAMSEGDQYGRGNNPVGTYNSASSVKFISNYMHISNLYITYGGRDVGGICVAGSYGLFEQNTIEDTYEFGTFKNRHQGVQALTGDKNEENVTGNVFRNNTIVNARQSGISAGHDAEVYGNYIGIRSIATNSTGIGGTGNNIVRDNTIYGRGEHPIGIYAGWGSDNWRVYNNIIDLQTTALGEEYGSAYILDPEETYISNRAAGIRTTNSTDNSVFYNNQITIATSARYVGTYSPTGDVAYVNGGGKGLFVGLLGSDSSSFYGNEISVVGDGTYTYAITCSLNQSDGLFIYNNTITSDQNNIVIGDEYGECNGYPLIAKNTIIKTGSNVNYKTFSNAYNDTDRNAQIRIVSNTYQGGAAEDSIYTQPSAAGKTDIYFGTYSDGESYFDYRLHDNDNASSTLIREDFDPAITLEYRTPVITTSAMNLSLAGTGHASLDGAGYLTIQ